MTDYVFNMFVLIMSLLISWGVVKLVRRQKIMAIPNSRSSHSIPTPVGGGLGIVLGVEFTIVALFFSVNLPPAVVLISVLGLLIAIFGWIDDTRELSSKFRLYIQIAVAIITIVCVAYLGNFHVVPLLILELPFVISCVLMIVLIIGSTNAYNFMDGIDGISGVQAVVASVAWTLLLFTIGSQSLAVIALSLSFATLGFLSWNLPSPARIFMGDVGSTFLGYLFATLPLLLALEVSSDRAVVVGFIFIGPFIFDTTITIIRRLIAGENILTPHRQHLYQRLVILGYSHNFVTTLYGIMAVISAVFGFVFYFADSAELMIIILLLLIGLYGILFVSVTFLEHKRTQKGRL